MGDQGYEHDTSASVMPLSTSRIRAASRYAKVHIRIRDRGHGPAEHARCSASRSTHSSRRWGVRTQVRKDDDCRIASRLCIFAAVTQMMADPEDHTPVAASYYGGRNLDRNRQTCDEHREKTAVYLAEGRGKQSSTPRRRSLSNEARMQHVPSKLSAREPVTPRKSDDSRPRRFFGQGPTATAEGKKPIGRTRADDRAGNVCVVLTGIRVCRHRDSDRRRHRLSGNPLRGGVGVICAGPHGVYDSQQPDKVPSEIAVGCRRHLHKAESPRRTVEVVKVKEESRLWAVRASRKPEADGLIPIVSERRCTMGV